MNYYYPPNKTSKANWVLDAMSASNLTGNASVVWGLGGNNFNIVKQCQTNGSNWIFTDMPYFNRWMGNNRFGCHWRIIPNSLHCFWTKNFPNDRFNSLNIKIKDWSNFGDYILVCPSSITMERFYGETNWLNNTIETLKKYTDRPIKIRNKPRANNTSGPRAATIAFEQDCKNAWAVVTLASIAGVEAICMGKPVFCHINSPCASLGNIDLSQIENPKKIDRQQMLNTLAYYQYTENEIKLGFQKEIFNDLVLSK